MKIVDNVYNIGVNDYILDLFEGQYPLPNGMAYNSYVILDEKIAVLDTVDSNFSQEWLSNLEKVLGNNKPDYLIAHHMEPDHSASLSDFLNKYPNASIVGNRKTKQMIAQFFPNLQFEDRFVEVKEGDNLSLGKNNLRFYFAPMVHWPEVIMSYEENNKILFSADAFGKFGALDHEEEWLDEARRYYFGIVGKYGKQVQSVLKKLAPLEINYICSLHGPTLSENIENYLNIYNTWSNYESEEEGVLIAYASMYGNTKEAAELLYKELKASNQNVEIFDLARSNVFDAMHKAFKYSKLVLATPTYNTGVLPFMETFINSLTSRNFQGKQIAIIENGSWAITAGRKIKEFFEKSQDIDFVEPMITISSSLTEKNKEEIKELSLKLAEEDCGCY